jgi:hypothetical protein
MKRKFIHKELAAGRWYQLSLPEQLANIGSEVSRARIWQEKDKNVFWGAVERALELFDLSLLDVRWKGRLREIARVKEVFCDAVTGGKEYKSNLQDLDRYFLNFTFLSQRR